MRPFLSGWCYVKKFGHLFGAPGHLRCAGPLFWSHNAIVRVVPTAFLFAALVAVTGAAAAGQHVRDSSHVESRFAPESVTFISTQTGWVLGTAPCASGRSCLALRETTDGGRDWSARVLPAALVATADRRIGGVAAEFYANGDANGRLNVRFADARDGWIYGGLAVPVGKARSGIIAVEPALWSTHDGGVTWRKQSLPGFPNGSIFDLEAGAGTVHLLWQNGAGVVTVDSSPVTLHRWRDTSRAVALRNSVGGAEDSGAIVLQGTTGWVVEGNDRGTYGSARLAPDGRWLPWKPPCASVGGGYRRSGCVLVAGPRRRVRYGWVREPALIERAARGDARVGLALRLT